MKLLALLPLCLAAPVLAQTTPMPGTADPRLQTIAYQDGNSVRLTAFPDAVLTLVFRPGERILRAFLTDQGAFEVAVVGDADSLSIRPLRSDASAELNVETTQGDHSFELATGEGLMAAYVVRIVAPGKVLPEDATPLVPIVPETLDGQYRLTGSREIRPTLIGDDGEKTYIEWGRYQALPAVFGIGPSGEEEVVNGYMRGTSFVIDRVYPELVFRIDDERVLARRREELAAQ